VAFLIETLAMAPPGSLTLCALGPLTNVALALAQEPRLAPRIARLLLMGGARDLGNVTPAAEFNMFVDPHAAAIVYGSGVPIVMLGLDVTHQAVGTPERVTRIAALNTPVARAVTGMLSRPRPGGVERLGTPGHPLHDPCVIAYLLWPELFRGRDCHVRIETASETTRGRTTVDWWGSTGQPPNAHVVDRVDAEELFRRLTRSLAKLR
jgi:purine nucleosidase